MARDDSEVARWEWWVGGVGRVVEEAGERGRVEGRARFEGRIRMAEGGDGDDDGGKKAAERWAVEMTQRLWLSDQDAARLSIDWTAESAEGGIGSRHFADSDVMLVEGIKFARLG